MMRHFFFFAGLVFFFILGTYEEIVWAIEDEAEKREVVGPEIGSLFSGRIFSDFYFPTSHFLTGDLQQISGSFWLEAHPKLSENSFGYFVFTANDVEASSVPGNVGFTTGLREGYVSYAKSGWEFRAGKMIIPWGKSDVINPTDFLTAKDYTFFNPDEEVKRIGAVSILVSWTPAQGNSPLTFTWIETPIFPQSQLLIAPNEIPSNISILSNPQVAPRTLSNSETAFKVSYAANQWDCSLLAFRGWNHLPDFQVVTLSTIPAGTSVVAAPTFHRYKALGADGSATFGNWILRGEGAYVWTENNDGQNPLIQPTHLDTVVGVERPLGDHFRAQAQFLMRYFPRYLSPSQIGGSDPVTTFVNQQVAETNALIQNYQDSLRPGATFRIAYSDEGSGINAEFFLIGNLVGGDYLARPQLTYSWTDSLKTTVGIDYYGGPTNRPLGVLAPYNAAFLEAKYLF